MLCIEHLGGGFVQGQLGRRRTCALIGDGNGVENGLNEAILTRRTVQVDEGKIACPGRRDQPVEIPGRVEGDDLVAEFEKGLCDLLGAEQGYLPFIGPEKLAIAGEYVPAPA